MGTTRRFCCWSIVAVFLSSSTALHAQSERLPVEVKGTLGYSLFPDNAALHHFVGGGSARFYFTRRLAFEPEFLYMYRDASDQDFHLVPNIAFDLRSRGSRVQPYVVGGVGLELHRELTGVGPYTSKSWTFGGGLGTKFFLNDRWFVAPEARLGWEPVLRITANVGYVFSGRKR